MVVVVRVVVVVRRAWRFFNRAVVRVVTAAGARPSPAWMLDAGSATVSRAIRCAAKPRPAAEGPLQSPNRELDEALPERL